MQNKQIIDIIVPSFNEEGSIEALFLEVKKHMKDERFRIIFVDDGSKDGTRDILKRLAKKDDRVKYISFSRNFGHQSALRAGLAYANTADAVISMDADLQHPPSLLPTLIKEWRKGFHIVYTRRDDTSAEQISLFKKQSSASFYRLMNKVSELDLDPGAADFRLLDKKVVSVINQFPEPDLFLRGLINWVGFKSIAIYYVPAKRFAGTSKYSLNKMINFAINGITQFSVKPLRMTIVLGVIMAAFAALYTLYAVLEYFLIGNNVSGWTSLIIVVMMTSGIQLILLGVVGEYVGKTFIQTKGRPDYIVEETNLFDS